MVRITDNKQRRMKKRIFDKTIAWMNGEITAYAVAKHAKTTHTTCTKWLNIFKAEIEKQKEIIPGKVIKSIEAKRGISTWKRLRNLIVKTALSKKASSTS